MNCRLGQPLESLHSLAVGRAVLTVCREAYDWWSARVDNDLTAETVAPVAGQAAKIPGLFAAVKADGVLGFF